MTRQPLRGRAGGARRRGWSLPEVLIASAILAVVATGAVAGFIYVRRITLANNLRTVAMFAAQQTVESLRAEGAEALRPRLALDAVPDNGLEGVWELDAVGGGLVPARVLLRAVYRKGRGGQLVQDPAASWWMDQAVTVYAQGDAAGPTETALRVYLDLEWSASGMRHRDAIFTLIE